jgi:hypothetical protein
MEDLPEDQKAVCISADRLYFRKHNPFVSFKSVRNNPGRLCNETYCPGGNGAVEMPSKMILPDMRASQRTKLRPTHPPRQIILLDNHPVF